MAIVFIADQFRNLMNPHLGVGQQAGDMGNSRTGQLSDDGAAQLGMKRFIQGAMRETGHSDDIRYPDGATGVLADEPNRFSDIRMANRQHVG